MIIVRYQLKEGIIINEGECKDNENNSWRWDELTINKELIKTRKAIIKR